MYFAGKAGTFPLLARDESGESMRSEHVVLGVPIDYQGLVPLDIKKGDWFEYEDKKYEVLFVHHDRRYQVKADVKVVTSG
jgi:hypothetical protein